MGKKLLKSKFTKAWRGGGFLQVFKLSKMEVQAIKIKIPKIRVGITPSMPWAVYVPIKGKGVSYDFLLRQLKEVHRSNKYLAKNPLTEGDILTLKNSIKNILDGRGGWNELDNGISINFVKDTDIKCEVHDSFEGRDTESYTYFNIELYREVFKDKPHILAELKAKEDANQSFENYMGDVLDACAESEKIYEKVIDEFIKTTDDEDLVEDEIAYGDGVHGSFNLKGHKYYFYYRDY